MLLVETAIFYGLIGCGVAVAVYIRGESCDRVSSTLTAASAILFWALVVPGLLAGSESDAQTAANSQHPKPLAPPSNDAMSAAIDQVETALHAALEGLDGWAENVLASEQHRLEE